MMNESVAEVLEKYADFLEMKKENPFRIKAYRKTACTVAQSKEAIEVIASRGGLEKLSGVGKDMAKKIEEILSTGTLQLLERDEGEIPENLSTLLNIPGLSPGTAKFLYYKLRIECLEDLEKLARSHFLRTLPGISRETEEKILKSLSDFKENPA